MPTLPTFTVTDATASRILAAFQNMKDDAGATLTPANAYKRWLKDQLVHWVTTYESEAQKTTLGNEMT